MKLGDIYWVKKYNLRKGNYRYDDTQKIMRIARDKFNIDLTFIEALSLWEYISGCYSAGWLNCDNNEYVEELLKEEFEDLEED